MCIIELEPLEIIQSPSQVDCVTGTNKKKFKLNFKDLQTTDSPQYKKIKMT